MTPKQRSAIAGLLTGKTIRLVADSVNVTERTIFRWLNDERFSAELHRAELQVLDAVGWRLVSLSGKATDALSDVLENPSIRGASVKRLTAKDILELLLKWREHLDFDTRLTKLEEKVLGNGK